MRRTLLWLGLVVPLALGTWPGGIASAGAPCPVPLPRGSDPVVLDPADFVPRVDNVYWPMAPGSRWVYRESDAHGNAQKVVVKVLWRTKQIEGITATVVHDVVSEGGERIENTFDWYAQDACDNVWYLGENTEEYENGVVVSTEGSWQHGKGGAMAGVIVPGDPQVGLKYREEYLAGEAEDAAKVLSLNEQAQVPYGHFWGALLTKNFTPLHPKILEYKIYAKGIGPVLVFGVSGGNDQEELIRYHAPA